MKQTFKNVVVLLSGGLDSSTLAYLAAKESKSYLQNRVFILTFDYGQRHKKELECAKKISREVGAVEHQVVKFDLTLWGGSSLTEKDKKVPQKRKLTDKSIPNTYVPARNTIFLSFALAYAEAINAEEIYIGVNSVDYSGYVDCRRPFINKFQELIKLATVAGVKGRVIKIKTPLMNLSKAGIVKLGKKLGVNWSLTWSCYLGGKKACGLCDSCQLRLKGFALAGIKDPLKYKEFPPFYKINLKKL
ncbi:MAG: 7-cyano-7-deazaguanine synthase QueC [Candidatus Melainabacteria bacterium]|nr:7-cyano-7-deazaguanine synthase QueC [Candidatus Melainabacteria bacterium]